MNKLMIAGGVVVAGIGLYDLTFGRSGSPIPVIGQYLTQEYDVVLLVIGAVLIYFGTR